MQRTRADKAPPACRFALDGTLEEEALYASGTVGEAEVGDDGSEDIGGQGGPDGQAVAIEARPGRGRRRREQGRQDLVERLRELWLRVGEKGGQSRSALLVAPSGQAPGQSTAASIDSSGCRGSRFDPGREGAPVA